VGRTAAPLDRDRIVSRSFPEDSFVIRSFFADWKCRPPCFGSLLLTALFMSGAAIADEFTCGPLTSSFGPYDYRTAKAADIKVVEDYHFTKDVQTLKAGSTSYVGGDLHYTLTVFPNHHRALAAMMNLQFKAKTEKPLGATYSVPCYFDRAIRFTPDDATVHALFGVYLMRLGKHTNALQEFETAERLGDDSGNLHYNLGLAYFETRDYEKSLAHAKKAYGLGFNLPGLKEKLSKAGKWQDVP
jgi:tetratricopeptide (TPR) repeat protein